MVKCFILSSPLQLPSGVSDGRDYKPNIVVNNHILVGNVETKVATWFRLAALLFVCVCGNSKITGYFSPPTC